jgi:gliding motility-associated-like protein
MLFAVMPNLYPFPGFPECNNPAVTLPQFHPPPSAWYTLPWQPSAAFCGLILSTCIQMNMGKPFFHILISALLSGVCINASGQRNNTWYFGNKAGLSFKGGSPVAITNSAMHQLAGSAVISDASGNLLFYTNGVSVWNARHEQMPNGTLLNGDFYAAQSALIIPKPGDCRSYYIFTTSSVGLPPSYSIVDMNREDRLGDVTVKNVPIHPSATTQRLTSVQHANGKDYWVIAQEPGTNALLSFLVSPAGVSAPVITRSREIDFTGITAPYLITDGYMKVSGNRKKLCFTGLWKLDSLTGFHSGISLLMDFDPNTGIASNFITLPHDKNGYGVEFSPDNTKLYIAEYLYQSRIYQYDITGGSAGAIRNSKTTIALRKNLTYIAALQAGPDQKIYVVADGSTFLNVISHPNLPGNACGYLDSAISLKGRASGIGLPNTIAFSKTLPDSIYLGNDTTICRGSSVLLQAPPAGTYRWYRSPTGKSPFFLFSTSPDVNVTDSGTYVVELTNSDCPVRDTISVRLADKPALNLGNDTLLCYGSAIMLHSGISDTAIRYRWHTGQTTSFIIAAAPGVYILEASSLLCSTKDSINIMYTAPIGIDLKNDSTICGDIRLTLDTRVDSAVYRWNDQSALKTLFIDKPGTYSVVVTKNGCSDSARVTINSQAPPVVNLGNDTSACEGTGMDIDAGAGYSGYRWQDGSSSRIFSARAAGTYAVTVTDQHNCSGSDEITLSVNPVPVVALKPLIKVCGADVMLNPGSFNSYLWQDGSVTDSFRATAYGTYSVTVTDANHCSATAVTEIVNGCPGILHIPNIFTPNGDRINDHFIPVIRNIRTVDLSIYNRWGMQVFHTTVPHEGWDGIYEGSEAVSDVYIYVLRYTDFADDHTKSITGNVTLLR